MSLPPVSAISDMVAPVVLITLAALFANGLLTLGANLADNVYALSRERLSILRGPNGEMLDEDSAPPADRARLTQIRDQMLLMTRRVHRIRIAVLITWIAIGLLVLSVAAIAVAVAAHSESFALVALALTLAGVAGVFAAIASLIGPAARRADAVVEEASRIGMRS